MRRWIAIAWHAAFFAVGAALYFFFVLPRWFELTGAWTSSLGTPMRIVDGLVIGLAALPIVFTLLRSSKPEFGTPQLALSLRLWAISLHVLAGVLIVGAAVAESWLDIDSVGQWLFGIYGAAAALAVLGALCFYLAYVAELPPPPPKPIQLKSKSSRRGRGNSEDAAEAEDTEDTEDTEGATATVEETEPTEAGEPVESDEETVEPSDTPEPVSLADEAPALDEPDATSESEGKLRNRRPGGKSSSRFRRRSGGVALDE